MSTFSTCFSVCFWINVLESLLSLPRDEFLGWLSYSQWSAWKTATIDSSGIYVSVHVNLRGDTGRGHQRVFREETGKGIVEQKGRVKWYNYLLIKIVTHHTHTHTQILAWLKSLLCLSNHTIITKTLYFWHINIFKIIYQDSKVDRKIYILVKMKAISRVI